jgi:glyoxylase-like metal-dependent hydrolase (beta-lactamase superfamily II)
LARSTTEITYPFAVPDYATPVEIAPGFLWLRLRLPFALDHINIWIIEDGDGWTVVDTGVGDVATREIWAGLLGGLMAAKGLRRIILTHFHPDHAGQVGWLCSETGAELAATHTEWLMTRALALDETPGYVEAGAWLDHAAGLDEDFREQRRARGNLYRRAVTMPPASFSLVRGGDRLRLGGAEWEVLIGQGHAPEQITLFCPERAILIAADQVLPRISPVVGVWPQIPEADPLGDFLRSLERYRHLPPDLLVLPSHGLPFYGLHARLDQLAHHHEERLERTFDACRTPSPAALVMRSLFNRELTLQNIGFAQAETLAHLNRLLRDGRLARSTSPEGVWLFRQA